MSLIRRGAVSMAAALVLGALSAGLAQGSTMSVQAAVRAQDTAIAASPTIKKLLRGDTPKSLPAAIKLFSTLENKLRHAAGVVGKASATTAQDRAGQRDWVKAARTEVTAFSQYVVAFRDLERHARAAAKREGRTAQRTLVTSSKLTTKADGELGLPAGA